MKHLIKTTLLLLALLLPALALAHDFEVDGIYYKTSGNIAVVTRSPYNNYSGNLIIPSSVTWDGWTYSVSSIGSEAFYNCENLTSIEIPNSVTCIGYYAFYRCTGLTSIEIPNSVTRIGNEAFNGTPWYNNQPDGLVYAGLVAYKYKGTMPNGTNLVLRNGTSGIADDAFNGCTGLTSIVIPNSVTTIGRYAFSGCKNLTSIYIPNSVSRIGYEAFNGTPWYNNQPDGLVYAGSVAYKYKGTMPNGTNLVLRNGTSGIADDAFNGCTGLTSIVIPNSVISIGNGAFGWCTSLVSIEIPNSVTLIDGIAFPFCNNLVNIKVASGNPYYDSRDNCNAIIETASNTLIAGCQNSFIPNSVSSICGAFWGHSGLTSIVIPNSVTTIDATTFEDCSGLTSIVIPNSVTYLGNDSFCGCTSLTSIVIPNSITFNDHAFADEHINPSTLMITGEGEWQCSGIGLGTSRLYIDSQITSIKGISVYPVDDIYCYASIPPECSEGSFFYYNFYEKQTGDYDYSATLHVPATSLAAYFTAPYWRNFENIVGDAVAITEIAISMDSIETQLNEQIELTATVTPSNASCQDIIWISTNPNVATVNNGTVTTVGNGECDIIASCFGTQAICHVSVTNRITLDQQEAMLLPNHIITLMPSAPVLPNSFTATSSDPTVAAARVMSGKVQVVGIKEGTTTITVGSADGTAVPATCLVTVYTEPGDVNMDGFVTISDITQVIDFMLGTEPDNFKEANADLNSDGNVTIADVTALIDMLLNGNS